jgi:hypothetical protein
VSEIFDVDHILRILADQGLPIPQQRTIDNNCCIQMDEKPISRDPLSTLVIWFRREPTFDHPPPNNALQPKESGQACQPPDHGSPQVPPSPKVYLRQNIEAPNKIAKTPVGPLNKKDKLESFKVDFLIRLLVLWEIFVFLEFDRPLFLGRGQLVVDWPPFDHGQT